MAVWTTAIISLASAPKAVKPRMRSSAPINAFADPRVWDKRVRPKHHGHGNAGDAGGDALGLDLVLVHAHMGQLRVGEQAIGNEPAARGAAAPAR
jgi:hypothetical protein